MPASEKLKEAVKEALVENTTVYNSAFIAKPEVYGYLEHKPTGITVTVYKPMSWFKKKMFKYFFDIDFNK